MKIHAFLRGLIAPALAFLILGADTGVAGAQEPVTISGVVFGDSAALHGASVRIPELGMSTVTDESGRYRFIVPSSRVRGQTVTIVARATRFNPVSTPVVLVGGTLVRDFNLVSARGGAVRNDPLRDTAAAVDRGDSTALAGRLDLASALTGWLPGLRVSSSALRGGSVLMISRGLRSINGAHNTLILLDGIPLDGTQYTSPSQRFGFGGFDYGSAIQDINPSDILSVRFLQGADATRRYGGRAANGVIELSTRNGRGLNGIEYSATHRMSFDSPQALPSLQNRFGQGSSGQFSFFDGQGNGTNDDVPQSWGPAFEGQPLPQASYTEARFGDVRYWLPRPDNLSSFYRDVRTNVTDASVAGGNTHGDFRVSLRNMGLSGLTPLSSIGRRSISMTAADRLTSRLHLAAHLSYIASSFDKLPGTGFDEANPAAALLRMPRQVDADSLRSHLQDESGNQISWIYDGRHNNPYFGSLLNDNRATRGHLVAGAAADFDLTPWLSASGRFSSDRISEERSFLVEEGWFGGFATELGRVPFVRGGQRQELSTGEDNLSFQLSAQRGSPAGFGLSGFAGAGLRRNRAEATTTIEDATDELVSRTRPDPSYSGSAKTVGIFAGSTIAYRNVASANLSAHRETADYLPSANESRVYPAASLDFDARQAFRFISAREAVDALSLRASWARSSSDITPYVIRSAYSPRQEADSFSLAYHDPVERGTQLKPEVTTMVDLRADVALFRRRLGLTFTVYREETTDLLLAGGGAGEPATAVNDGAVTNSGIQSHLSLVALSRGRFDWTTDATITRNTSTVRDLLAGSSLMGPARWGVTLEARNGQPLGVLVGTGFQRHEPTGQMLLVNGLPVATTGVGILGSVQPKWFGGVTNTLRYAGVEFSFLFDGQVGGRVFSTTNLWGSYTGNLAETEFRPDTGIVVAGIDAGTGQPNAVHVTTEDYYHALGGIAERWVYDASYVKFRELRLTVPVGLPQIWRFATPRAEVSVIGRNLGTWARVPNVDPESIISTSSFQGFELGGIPRARSIGLQLTIVP